MKDARMVAEELLRVSTEMVSLAQAGAWGDVTAQEAERARLLAQLPVADPAQRQTLQNLLAHNEQILQLAGAARDALGEALGQHQQRHRALSAYLHAGID
ncbi:flagellar protein FliT [Dyella solisilvae]|uniref:Flagellar protein FliT n=1 Tax=Dyella solisilvae TaxID=1920168 RepID=A0A370K5L0_9GAMM|nr:flagellar protein FliT [Dyella solisilvae]RDI97727.1 flagellar protein FliT [Dyella solisilvae]